MRLALFQTDILRSSSATHDTLSRLDAMMCDNVKGQEVDLIVLPEMFHCGFSADSHISAEEDGGEVVEWMRRVAKKYGCTVCGSASVREEDKYYNRLYCVDKEGGESHYDKRHLFSMGSEAEMYTAGERRLVVEIAGVRCLMQICYDLRFPVFSRYRGDYDAIIYVANWPASRIDVWNTLLKARAIENQSYVIGVNRTGVDDNIVYNGNTIVYDSRGAVVARAEGESPQVVFATLNIESQNAFRRKFPVLEDRDIK